MTKTIERQTVSKVGWKLRDHHTDVLPELSRPRQRQFRRADDEQGPRFTATIYGWGAGLFFVGYFLGEVPSNLALERSGAHLGSPASYQLGALSAAMALVSGPISFYAVRFCWVCEAGLFRA